MAYAFLVRARRATLVVTAALCCVLAVGPQGVTAAENDLEEGFEAALDEDWDEAVEHFGRAFERNPYNPIVQFNYGLAQARIGNELQAIALLQAYMAAVPSAANRPQVEGQIDSLEQAVENEIEQYFEVAIEAAEALPPGLLDATFRKTRRWTPFKHLASSRFTIGDVEEARNMLARANQILSRANAIIENMSESDLNEERIALARELEWLNGSGAVYLDPRVDFLSTARDFGAVESLLEALNLTGRQYFRVISRMTYERVIYQLENNTLEAVWESVGPGTRFYSIPADMLGGVGYVTWSIVATEYARQNDYDTAFSVMSRLDDFDQSRLLQELAITAAEEDQAIGVLLAQRLLDDSATFPCVRAWAYALLGQGDAAVQSVEPPSPSPFQDPHASEFCLAHVARYLVYAGNVRGARDAARQADRMALSRDRGGGAWAMTADAWVHFGNRRFGRAVNSIREAIEESDEAHARSVESVPYIYSAGFSEPAIRAALARGWPEGAEEIAEEFGLLEEWREEIADGYATAGDTRDAARMRREIERREEDRFAGWEPADNEHLSRVDAWLAIIRLQQSDELWTDVDLALRDLDAFRSVMDQWDPARVPAMLGETARVYARELTRMRATARRFE